MEIKAKIEQVVAKLMKDKNLRKKFDTNPTAVIEEIIGVDLPEIGRASCRERVSLCV